MLRTHHDTKLVLNMLLANGVRLETDNDGYLQRFDDWSEAVAEMIAASDRIILSEAHWEIIRTLRIFYLRYEQSPAMRPLVKFIGQQLGADKGNSIYLLKLFPGSPAKIASKIAGLPRPEHCL
ncbi:MAG: sulfur relay protein TusE [Verrucomicrobiaceae bacterium]|nr:sulfur relay protein TusE [Verrucomicrobiaceae bacterium]